MMKLVPHKQSAAAKAWIREESGEQHKLYVKISKYINETMAPKRAKRFKAFLERIQTRGYSVHFDQMRKIPKSEIPKEPKRKHRVVF